MLHVRFTRNVLLIISLLSAIVWLVLRVLNFTANDGNELLLPPKLWGSHPSRDEFNIMFIETSCAFDEVCPFKGVEWYGLTTAEQCSVESALRHNGGAQVYVLHTCQAPSGGAQVPDGATALYMPLDRFLKDTPLYKPLISSGVFYTSEFPLQHALDVLGLVALWKYGGVHLHFDFLVLRDLMELGENWVVQGTDATLSSRAIALSAFPGSSGQKLASYSISRLMKNFNPDDLCANGGKLVASVLENTCKIETRQFDINSTDIAVLPREMFNPLPDYQLERFISPEMANDTLSRILYAYALPMFDMDYTMDMIHKESAFGVLAAEHCPKTYSASRGIF